MVQDVGDVYERPPALFCLLNGSDDTHTALRATDHAGTQVQPLIRAPRAIRREVISEGTYDGDGITLGRVDSGL